MAAVKEYGTENIRNIVLLSHGGVGKTTLAEAMLYSSGALTRMGSVDDGNTASDYHSAEIDRKSSVQLSLLIAESEGTKINILDTPGYSDFIGEVISGVSVTDAGVILVSAQSAVEVGTQKAWDHINGKPAIFLVNRMDRENADYSKALKELQDAFGNEVAPIAIPIGSSDSFNGVIDLLAHKAYSYERGGKGLGKEIDIPTNLEDQIDEFRMQLMEAVAESDDKLLEKYFETGELSEEELINGLNKAVAAGKLYPVIPISASQNIGTDLVFNAIINLVPNPKVAGKVMAKKAVGDEDYSEAIEIDSNGHTSALVYKVFSEEHVGKLTYFRVYSGTVENGSELYNPIRGISERVGTIYVARGKERMEVKTLEAGDIGITVKLKGTGIGDTLCEKSKPIIFPPIDFPKPVIDVAVKAKQKGEEEKIATGLARLAEEDTTFSYEVDSELKQTLLHGQGELQLNMIVGKLKEQFGVDVELGKPKIKYRETIRKTSEAQGRHKKQTGGRGQFGDVWLRLEPLPRGEGYEFTNEISGGVVPGKFIPAVDKGVGEIMKDGVVAGFKVVDMRVALYDGSYHSVDSSEMAFKIAAHLGVKAAFDKADPYLLEPIDDVEIIVPEEFTGDVMGDISSRRGKISGMEPIGSFTKVKSQVPQAELYKYSTILRSLTQGRGYFTREFSHYAEVPYETAQKVIEESKQAKEEE
ncbi:elongation factor G [bacterium]|nr:elongation factor G [bacterium]